MGFFVLREAGAYSSAFAKLQTKAMANGFAEVKRAAIEHFELSLFASLSGSDPQFVSIGDDGFVASFGLLLYRGEIGPAALMALHQDFSLDDFDWAGLAGTFVVLIRKAGQLVVINDGLGASKLFQDADRSVLSNSFVALAELGCGIEFNHQGCFEYVFAGSCYGRKSPLYGIMSLPPNCLAVLDCRGLALTQLDSPILQRSWARTSRLDDVASYLVSRIDGLLEPIAIKFRNRLRLSFSGGFDSRLTLASLLKFDARPLLFTYGAASDPDVRIAREIAGSEGLAFEHIDKSKTAMPPPDEFAGIVERDFFAFDGWKSDNGILSDGADYTDRLRRHEGDQLPINGSLGEIYRNFYYLPDGSMTAKDLVSAFFSQYDPRLGGELFDERRYRAILAAEILESVGAKGPRLERWQVEETYPKFRGRFWTGHDGQINQRFGPMLFPFLEPELISHTARIPIALKDLGVLQGRMIALQCARLAGYPSSYGYPLGDPPPPRVKLAYLLTCLRPMWLRRRTFRLKQPSTPARPDFLQPRYLKQVVDPSLPYTRRLFRAEHAVSETQFNRIVSLEYIATRLGIKEPQP